MIFECNFLFYTVFVIPETYGYSEEHSAVLFSWYSLLSIIPRHEIHKNRASEIVSLTKCTYVSCFCPFAVTHLSGSKHNTRSSSCMWTTQACTWAMIENIKIKKIKILIAI